MTNPKTRMDHFEGLKTHPWYSRILGRLKDEDIGIIKKFIRENDHLDYSTFEYRLNRLFLNSQIKPKRFLEIMELLMIINSNKRLGEAKQ